MDIKDYLAAHFDHQDMDLFAMPDTLHQVLNVWKVSRLHKAANHLDVRAIPLADLTLSLGSWFQGDLSDINFAELAPHFRRVQSADLSYPVLIHSTEGIIDGAHRYLRALIEHKTEIKAQVFETMPSPDAILPLPDIIGTRLRLRLQ